MKNKNVKVIDEHNIDRNANVMFALELEGSEYAVYWIERDAESNNVFVSKVLKNIDGTYNMLNIDDSDKKEEVSNIVKTLISTSVSDQNDKLVGTETTLSNGKVVKFVNVTFNKEQHINVQKTYITTVKKEVTKVAENYYDVVVEVPKVEESVPSVSPVVEPTPSVVEPITVAQPSVVVETPVVTPTPIVSDPVSVVQPVLPSIPEPTVSDSMVAAAPVVAPQPVPSAPVVSAQPVVEPTPVIPAASIVVPATPAPVAAPVVEPPVTVSPVVEAPVQVAPTPVVVPEVSKIEPTAVIPTAVVPEPIVEPVNQPLVFDATKEKNLNAALGEVASATNIPVENIESVREFGVDTPVQQTVAQPQPAIAPMVQPTVTSEQKVLTKKAGFADSKFFMVVAVAFFLASCIFLGYEVFNYFQLIK